MVFLFVFFFWDSYDSNVGAFNIVPEVSEIVLIPFNSVFFFSNSFISTILSSTSLILSSACYSTVGSLQSVFDIIYCIIHYIWTLFISSRSLLNLSCIFSILSPGYLSMIQFCFQDFESFSLSLFGILYQVDSLSLPLLFFGGHLSCSFTAWVFLCLFILFILLCLRWPFCILAVCGVPFIVEFLRCGWGCTGGLSRFPGEGSLCQCSGGWSWISSLWSAMKCPVMSYEMSVVLG